jgi:DNA-binding transcriptional ArsR family regulator
MDMNLATQSFTALGHPGRLAVFRLLMRFAPQGVRPTELAETLALRQNTLSHYLNDLEAAGLIKGARQGRSILYAIDLDRTGALVDYLVEDCCRGRQR